MTDDDLAAALVRPHYPRSAKYDADWVFSSNMGPNVLWLAELLFERFDLDAGMRVLDLGCGRAASSVFLAREFDVTVWAVDNLVSPDENRQRVVEAGLEDRVHPMHADARQLPFPEEHFDAVVCLDAYQYFGTDALYLRSLLRFVRPGGRVGVVVPGVSEELDAMPDDLPPLWRLSYETYHGPDWWRRHWERTPGAVVELADWVDRRADWADWLELYRRHDPTPSYFGSPQEIRWLRSDASARFGLVRGIVARARD